ncbi:MAG TPA: hypothetical protein VGJ90_00595 [Methylophilaceae bacterium]
MPKFIWILVGAALSITGCATTPMQQPPVARISPEELEHIMPKPVPNLSLDEIVALSKANTPAEQIIEKIKVSNSHYDLTPSQAVDLSKRGVDGKVLDYIYQAREQALRDGFADEINKREKDKVLEQEKLKRELRMRSQPYYYDPFYGPSPYWYRRPYGPSMYYRFGW